MLFKGCSTALITPFKKDGSVNFNVFKKIIDYQIGSGVSSLVFLGTTGESSTLTEAEREEVVRFAVSYVNKRVPVIVGAGSNSTSEAIKRSVKFEKLGVDALLHVTPYYNKSTQQGLIEHYTQIANSVKIPIVLYNVPGRTGVNILPQTVLQLSKVKNIVGIKEASGNIEQVSEISRICAKDFSIYSGDDALTLPILCLGGNGVISVASNALPKKMVEICEHYFIGNIEHARELQFKMNPFIKLMFSEVNPIPIKYAMKKVGFDCGTPRLPLLEPLYKTKLSIGKCLKEIKN